MCELTGGQNMISAVFSLRKPRISFERWFVFDMTNDDPEVFVIESEARARAAECNRRYPHIAPFRVVKMREVTP